MPPTMSPPDFFVDARDDLLLKSSEKQKNALNHFNCFLKKCCLQIGIMAVEAAAIPFQGIPRKSSNKLVFEFWDKMIGAFVTHMATSARIGCNPTCVNPSHIHRWSPSSPAS